jgi:hypothetical protein
MNAATLAAAISAVDYVAQSSKKSDLTNFLIPQAKANNFYWAGGNDFKASIAIWSGSNASASTSPDFTNTLSGLANAWGGTNNTNAAFNTADNLWFGSQPTAITGWTWTNNIGLGSSNVSLGSFNFLSGSSNYTFSATNTKKLNIGLATQTQAAITNNSSSAITFNAILAAQGGLSSTSATTFAQNTTTGSLSFSGSTTTSSYIINPYAYDWALAQAGTTAAQAKTFATSTSANQALTAADGNSGSRYVKLAGIGTITVGAAIGDAFRGNMGTNLTAFRSVGSTNLVIFNTGTTNLFGWNTYTGSTIIGDGTASGGNVIIGTPYAFGGNRVTDTTAPFSSSATAYTVGTVSTGFSINTQAFGTVTVNSGFSIDLNGINMLGANQLSLTGSGSLGSGVIKNTSTNSATYAGLVVVTNTSTMSTSYGNITFSGGLNTSSKTLTIDGASNTYITGPIIGSTGGRIQKIGNGTLTLSGSNSAPMTLKVVAGNVVVANPDALSTTGVNSISDSGANASDTGTLILTGGLSNSNAYRVSAITPGGNLTISTVGGDSTLTIDGASGSGQSGTVEKN